MKKCKMVFALLVAVAMVFSFASISMAATNSSPDYIRTYLEDQEIQFDVHPFLTGGTVYAGFRGIFEALGYTVKYDMKTKIVTGLSASTTIMINLKTNEMTINGGKFDKIPPKPPTPILIKGRTLVPIRFISEASGLDVEWIKASQIIRLTYKKPDQNDLDAIKALLIKNKKAAAEGNLIDLLATFDTKSPIRNDYKEVTAITFPNSASTFEDIKIKSWQGNKATISYKVTTKGDGEEFFLDRLDLIEAILTRTAVGGWKIYDIKTKSTTYPNANDNGLQEVTVPDAEKTAILAVVNANVAALNAEDAVALNTTYNGDASVTKQLVDAYAALFKKYDIKFTNEVERIIYYKNETAFVYVKQKSEKQSPSDYENKRLSIVFQVNKDKSGIWKINPVSQIIFTEKL
ncbi:copper amine oxidase N-terminal domain-containing protein [Paenibacillus sp. GCM10023250]|uniref:copper amine oxidase N-terminal domain-containing protein n=1 Tax=Paenibacillus sp. GCM10023250 TaxID=3252648 RepID=UPI003609E6BE